MDNEVNNDIKILKELCIKFIDIFDSLKDKNMIDELEYEEHTENKKEFLNGIRTPVK